MSNDLRFKCQRSGECCTNPSMRVTLTNRDILHLFQVLSFKFDLMLKRIDFIDVTDPSLKERMVFPSFRTTRGEVVISLHKLENGECVFYNPNSKKCNIYEVRPVICRSYPFVFSKKNDNILILISPNAESTCIGIGKEESVDMSKLISLGKKILDQIAEMAFIAENINLEAGEEKPLTLRETLLVILNYASQK